MCVCLPEFLSEALVYHFSLSSYYLFYILLDKVCHRAQRLINLEIPEARFLDILGTS